MYTIIAKSGKPGAKTWYPVRDSLDGEIVSGLEDDVAFVMVLLLSVGTDMSVTATSDEEASALYCGTTNSISIRVYGDYMILVPRDACPYSNTWEM